MLTDEAFIKHIQDAINTIESYVQNMDRESFLLKENRMVQDAVIRQFEIIGEATGRLSDDIKKEYPDLPWKSISNMRNKLIHEYFGVELEVVWGTVEVDLPILKEVAEKITKAMVIT